MENENMIENIDNIDRIETTDGEKSSKNVKGLIAVGAACLGVGILLGHKIGSAVKKKLSNVKQKIDDKVSAVDDEIDNGKIIDGNDN